MAPASLDVPTSPQSSGLLNSAISTATSPLQASFHLSCRSPVRSTHDASIDTGVGVARASDSHPHYPAFSIWQHSPHASHALLSPCRSFTSTEVPGTELTSPPFLAVPPQHPLRASSPSESAWPASRRNEDGGHNGHDNAHSLFLRQEPSCPRLPPSHQTSYDDDDSSSGKLGVVSAVNIIVGKTIGVGAYSVPSAIFAGVGSVGMTLLVWVVGSLISFCGLAVYLDLGTALPRSGGERVYLERIFRRPRMLATCMFMAYAVLLGFSAPNAIVLGEYTLFALDVPANRWNVRTIAVVTVTALCYVHAHHPRLGLRLINILGAAKMLTLIVVVLSGVAGGILGVGRDRPLRGAGNGGSSTAATHFVMGHHLDADMAHMASHAAGVSGLSTARRNFQNVWAGSSCQPYDYATALLKVVYCFRGYSTANQVLSDVKDPVRTLRVAAPLALVLVSLSYVALNVAFFLVVDKDEFRSAGVIAAGVFFRNLFGDGAGARVLPIFVTISAAGNIAATSFAQARVNEELAKDDLLPFAATWRTPTGSSSIEAEAEAEVEVDASPARRGGRSRQQRRRMPTPARGLLLHWLVSVVVIVVPPPGKIYNFLVDLGGYPVSVISVAISAGLLYLHITPSQRWMSPWPAPHLATVVFATSNCLLLILPWIPPADGRGENKRFASYAYPTTALAVIGSGALFWLCWRYRDAGKTLLGSMTRLSTGESRRSPLSWARLKTAMSCVGARASSFVNGSILRSIAEEEEGGDSQSAAALLQGGNGAGSSQPVIHITNIRRRAPCGCPSLH